MRPARKARGGRIPGVCNRRATRRPGMQRRPNVTGLRGHDTRLAAMAAKEKRRFIDPMLLLRTDSLPNDTTAGNTS
jgi:hypothetical protein